MALAIHLVVHIDRVDGQRLVSQVIGVDGYDNGKDQFITSTPYPGGYSTAR
jgi:hypothetical protein